MPRALCWEAAQLQQVQASGCPRGLFHSWFSLSFLFFFSFPHPTDCSRSSAPHARAVQPRDPPLQGAAALGTRGQLWAHGSMQERGSTTNSCFAHGLCAS